MVAASRFSHRLQWGLVAGLLFLALVVCTWAVPYVPTNDGPQHVLSADIENHLAQPDSFQGQLLDPAPQYAARGFALVYEPLSAMLPWDAALRLTWLLSALLCIGGACLIASTIDSRRAPVGLLVGLAPFGWSQYMGFFPYSIGQGFGLLLLGFFLRWRRPMPGHFVLIGLGLLFQSYLHLFSALLSGLCLGIVVLVRAQGRERLRQLALLLVASAPVLALTMLSSSGQSADYGSFATKIEWMPFHVWFDSFVFFVAPGPGWRAALAVGLMGAGLVLGLIRAVKHAEVGEQRAVWGVALLLFVLGTLGPKSIPGWQFVAPRLLYPAFVCGLCTLPLERFEQWAAQRRPASLVKIGVLGLASLGLFATLSFHRLLSAHCADTFGSLGQGSLPSQVDRSIRLPLVFGGTCQQSQDVPNSSPLMQAGALFAAVEGGLVPYLFQGTPSAHAIMMKPSPRWPPIPPLELWMAASIREFHQDQIVHDSVVTRWAVSGTHFDGILVFGAQPAEFAQLEARGYVFERRRGEFGAAHFVPCPLTLRVERDQTSGVDHVRLGLVPDPLALLERDLSPPPGDSPVQGTLRANLGRLPCGPMWLNVNDDHGAVCDLTLNLTRNSPPVACLRQSVRGLEDSQP